MYLLQHLLDAYEAAVLAVEVTVGRRRYLMQVLTQASVGFWHGSSFIWEGGLELELKT